ncbi:signal peptidase I [Akkermansiaceae bacterium]|jgi:signal peptidase I|nr:signal peptidase I [Akkermansiaceae bacterium]MDB4423617.1 signal peptidase I [bacterium]MDA7891543.1 signal peptidase I [Akkermansiaceae bacterium]MDA7933704.1 signal peptidase I [Akkermansiaceae bacterium]MDA9829969.1 signal peptidase I [Akkermansiaceae bacterium]
MKKLLKKKWQEWRGTILFLTCVVLPVRSSIASLNFVPTGSMNPTIQEGDFVFSNLLAYDLRVPMTDFRIAQWDEPDRGDIVICFASDDDTRLVKRVIGVPGDEIEMRNLRVLINGVPLGYGPLSEEATAGMRSELRAQSLFATENLDGREHAVMALPGVDSPYRSFAGKVLGEGEYFVMGDNRDNSKDSRIFGVVEREKIVGEATRVVMSFNKPDKFQPRWDRFFMRLR